MMFARASLWNDGKWDEIVERADAFVEQFGAEAHYQAAGAHIFRGFVRAGRGDDAGAADDAARAWEVARPIGDPQVAGNTLLASTFTFMVIGASDRAAKMFDEALELFGECRSSDGSSLSCTPSRGWAGSSGAARMYWPR